MNSRHGDGNSDRPFVPGVMVGIVTRIDDPESLGRVKVSFPRISDEEESNWARVATFMAGNDRGALFFPEVGDEVLVLFENGDPTSPFVVGSLHNGVDVPPSTPDEANNIRMIKSRSGHVVKLDDTDGSEKIEIIDSSGNQKILFDAQENKISIESSGDLELKAPDGSLVIDVQDLTITASGDLSIEADGDITADASGNLDLTGSEINLN